MIDTTTEEIVCPTAWYAPYFANQATDLIGVKVPGTAEAVRKAVAAHEQAMEPWLTAIGWDCMITEQGAVFFEGNVAAQRTPRRIFLTAALTQQCYKQFRRAPASRTQKTE